MSPLPASTRRLVRNFQQPPLHYSIVVLQRRGSANPNRCVHAHRNGAAVLLHHTRREDCQLLCGRQKRRKQVRSPPSANRQMRRVTPLYVNSPDVFGAVYAWTLRVRCRWSVDAALYRTSSGSTTTHTHTTRGLEHGPTSAGRRDGSKQLMRRAHTHSLRASRESERSRAFYARRKSAGLGTVNDDDARFQQRSRRQCQHPCARACVCV